MSVVSGCMRWYFPDTAISSSDTPTTFAIPGGKESEQLTIDSSVNKVFVLQTPSVTLPPEKLVLVDAPDDSSTPRDAEGPPINPPISSDGNPGAANALSPPSYDDQLPGQHKYPHTGSFTRRNPADVPLPVNLSSMSLGLTPVSYRSSVFYLAITKFVSKVDKILETLSKNIFGLSFYCRSHFSMLSATAHQGLSWDSELSQYYYLDFCQISSIVIKFTY